MSILIPVEVEKALNLLKKHFEGDKKAKDNIRVM